MSDNQKRKKKYEPPMVKEIGGVFEQALGLTCLTGQSFSGTYCTVGPTPVLSGCANGPRDVDACMMGDYNKSKCARGTGVAR